MDALAARGLRKVALGLTILYCNLCLLLLLFVLLLLPLFWAGAGARPPEILLQWWPRILIAFFWYFYVLFPLFNIPGRALCLSGTPSVGSERAQVGICLSLDILALILVIAGMAMNWPTFAQRGPRGLGLTQLNLFTPELVTKIGGYLALASPLLFLIYLRSLARNINCTGTAVFAMVVLILSILMFGTLIFLVHTDRLPSLMRQFGPKGGMLFLVALVAIPVALYGRLLTMIRGEIREQVDDVE